VKGANLKEVNSKFLEQQMKRPEPQILFLYAADGDSFGEQIVSFGSIPEGKRIAKVGWLLLNE
jgi:hypothetical protein